VRDGRIRNFRVNVKTQMRQSRKGASRDSAIRFGVAEETRIAARHGSPEDKRNRGDLADDEALSYFGNIIV